MVTKMTNQELQVDILPAKQPLWKEISFLTAYSEYPGIESHWSALGLRFIKEPIPHCDQGADGTFSLARDTLYACP